MNWEQTFALQVLNGQATRDNSGCFKVRELERIWASCVKEPWTSLYFFRFHEFNSSDNLTATVRFLALHFLD